MISNFPHINLLGKNSPILENKQKSRPVGRLWGCTRITFNYNTQFRGQQVRWEEDIEGLRH